MKRFIRTKDEKIIEISELNIPYQIIGNLLDCNSQGRYKIIKQADTIEELCDEFVYEKELYNRIEKGEDLENQTRIRLFDISFFDLYIEEWNDIYGAIWTDKGLIYVAKMNDKGELELL